MARLQPPSAAGAEGGGGHHEVAKVAVNDSLDVVVRKLRGVTQVILIITTIWRSSFSLHWPNFSATFNNRL